MGCCICSESVRAQARMVADVSTGSMPWAARDLMQWPVATAGQGVIDLVVQTIVTQRMANKDVELMSRSPGRRW